MVYETEIPNVPTRNEELMMIQKIKQNFQDQPNYKFYMNEGVRLAKMDFGQQRNDFRLSFWANFGRGLLFSSLILVPIANVYRYTNFGVPIYHEPKRYAVLFSSNFQFYRYWKQVKFLVPSTLFCAWVYAHYRTSHEPLLDEYFEKRTIKFPY